MEDLINIGGSKFEPLCWLIDVGLIVLLKINIEFEMKLILFDVQKWRSIQ